MIKNYIKTAWRNLLKNKLYSFINIAGLTVGLAIGILILLWVQDELGFDRFHKQAANIYRLEVSGGTGASVQIFTSIVAPMAPVAKTRYLLYWTTYALRPLTSTCLSSGTRFSRRKK